MRLGLFFFMTMVLFSSCKNEHVLPDGMKEGLLTASSENPIFNEKKQIPMEVLNYKGITAEERDFLIELTSKKRVSFCLEDGKFDSFLDTLRKHPQIKDLLLSDQKISIKPLEHEELRDRSFVVYGCENGLKSSKVGVKSALTETRLRYLKGIQVGLVDVGRLLGRSEAQFDAKGQLVDGKLVLVFRKQPGLAASVYRFRDLGSFANANSAENTLYCRGIGELYTKMVVNGVEVEPVVQAFEQSWKEVYGGSGNGGDPGIGDPGPSPGQDQIGRAYLNSTECYGESIMCPDMRFAFNVLRAKSFKPFGVPKCFRNPEY